MDVLALAEEIINGRRLKRGEDLSFFLTWTSFARGRTASGPPA